MNKGGKGYYGENHRDSQWQQLGEYGLTAGTLNETELDPLSVGDNYVT